MKKTLTIIFIILLIATFGIVWKFSKNEVQKPIISSDELDKTDLIQLDSPRPNQIITSPLIIKGKARGTWFFEASFPIDLVDWDGRIIAQGIASAKSDWMTEDFVPFEASLDFTIDKDVYSYRGALILHRDNPSGLPENDDALEIPIEFAKIITSPTMCTADAKLCPDGSAVGRIGPNCEFAQCPNTDNGGGGSGIVPFKY